MPQNFTLAANKIQDQLHSMRPCIQVPTCNGTTLSHQANQNKTTKKTRIKDQVT